MVVIIVWRPGERSILDGKELAMDAKTKKTIADHRKQGRGRRAFWIALLVLGILALVMVIAITNGFIFILFGTQLEYLNYFLLES